MSRSFDARVWSLFQDAAIEPTLTEAVAAAGDQQPALNVTTVLSTDGNPLRFIAHHATSRAQLVAIGGAAALRLSKTAGGLVVSAWPTEFPGVYHLVTTAPASDETWKQIERWIANASPEVSRFLLDRHDFDRVIDALADAGEVRTNRITWHTRSDRTSTHRGFPERPLAREALERIAESEGGIQVRTAHLWVTDHQGEPVLKTYLRRQAGASFNGGAFELFYNEVLRRLAESGGRRVSLLRGRQRLVGERPPAAVAIELDEAYFDGAEMTAKLIESLASYRHGDVAVLHRNPYLHLVVTDYTDGSNFDVFVTEEDQIALYGGYKASVGATARLTEYLSDRFAAEAVSTRPRSTSVPLEELFAAG